jgi:hypothetical protein
MLLADTVSGNLLVVVQFESVLKGHSFSCAESIEFSSRL